MPWSIRAALGPELCYQQYQPSLTSATNSRNIFISKTKNHKFDNYISFLYNVDYMALFEAINLDF